MSQDIVTALKDSYTKAEWWKFVQRDVRESLHYIIENIIILGVPFRRAFESQCLFERSCRVLVKAIKPLSESTSVLGTLLPEEIYQVGMQPTKQLLKLDDWTDPNEADVYACVVLCRQIAALTTIGVLSDTVVDIITPFLSQAIDG